MAGKSGHYFLWFPLGQLLTSQLVDDMVSNVMEGRWEGDQIKGRLGAPRVLGFRQSFMGLMYARFIGGKLPIYYHRVGVGTYFLDSWYHIPMNPVSVLVLRTLDGKSFEPLTREDFPGFSEAVHAIVDGYYYTLSVSEDEEPEFYDFFDEALESIYGESSDEDRSNPSSVILLNFPTWYQGKDLSPNTFVKNGYVFPVMLYRDRSSEGGGVLAFCLFNEGRMTFPVFSAIELLYHLDTVFVTADPSLFGVSLEDFNTKEGVDGGGIVIFPLSSREDNEEGMDIYGVWPWEAYLLPSHIGQFCQNNLYRGQSPEPVALLVTPEAVEANGGIEPTIKKILGSETLGVPVMVSFGEFSFSEEEEEEEY